MWCVYILKSERKPWYYIGSTNRLQERVAEHAAGKVRSTKGFLPVRLVHSIACENELTARQYEQRIKDKRTEKEALIRQIENNCRVV